MEKVSPATLAAIRAEFRDRLDQDIVDLVQRLAAVFLQERKVSEGRQFNAAHEHRGFVSSAGAGSRRPGQIARGSFPRGLAQREKSFRACSPAV
jgi:hypothetical protein